MSQSGASGKVIPFQRDRYQKRGLVKGRAEADSPPIPPNNLPLSMTPFIGRYEQVEEVCSLILDESVRLLVLTGPGGIGKTRLAIRAAEEMLPEFEDGAFFVELASVSNPELVVPTIAQTLGVKEEGDTFIAQKLRSYLSEKGMLLVLDNFEQVAGAAAQVTKLMAGAPGVQVIVTSRVSLHLYGEYEYLVPPMALPDAESEVSETTKRLEQYEAIQLFVARAREIRPSFRLTEANAKAIAQICRRLDGLPLALELAAARTRLFSPQALLARLGKSLPMLVGGPVDAPTRHSTLRNAIAWSYDLLDAREQRVFALMAVFVGGCTLDAAARVASDLGLEQGKLLETLESLIGKNLLRQTEQADGEPRFWLLATIREYAFEKLLDGGGLKDAQLAHAHFFLEFAEAGRETDMRGHLYEIWLPRMDRENDNMRAALRWSLDQGEGEIALRLAVALVWFWTARGYLVEGSRWLEEALAMSNGLPASLRADALYLAGWLATSQNDFARTKVFAEESLNLYQLIADKRGIAKALSHLGVVAAEQEDYARALSLFEQCLAVWRELGHSVNVAMLTGNLCFLALYEGDYERAISYGEESVGIQRALGNSLGTVVTGINLGLALLHAGNYARGMALHREMLAGAETLGSKKDMALTHTYLGLALLLQGDHEGASPHYKESLALFEELGNRFGIARALVGLAGVAAGEVQMRQAGILSGAAHALITATHGKLVPVERELDERTMKRAHSQLRDAAFTKAWEQGQAMSQSQGIAYALHNEVPEFSLPSVPESPIIPLLDSAPLSTDELSTRELEVVRLVAAGLTNKEIGERLVLSHRTVEAHLYSIFNKLNVTTRSAATRYALEHGLARERIQET